MLAKLVIALEAQEGEVMIQLKALASLMNNELFFLFIMVMDFKFYDRFYIYFRFSLYWLF